VSVRGIVSVAFNDDRRHVSESGNEDREVNPADNLICKLRVVYYPGNPYPSESGAAERIRTSDPRITNALLYRLSYRGADTTAS
jgi:hypothetical protein